MAVSDQKVKFDEGSLAATQELIRDLGFDGWLLYDFRGTNPAALGLLGLPVLSRRFFVLIPARGRPVALTHRIEQQPWEGWIGELRQYLSWQSLEEGLRRMLEGIGTVAVERSANDAVPYVDRLPAGVLEMIHATGTRTESSGDLVSAFYSRWTEEGAAGHRRAARILRETAFGAFSRIGDRLRAGDSPTEWEMRRWVADRLTESGLSVGADAIVAVDANAANPHYAPGANAHSPIGRENLILLDLWGKESADAIFADQTWMAFTGSSVPERIVNLWNAVRDARVAAVELVRSRHSVGGNIAGFEVDDAARRLLSARGLDDVFLHRTGHSIDRDLHGSGPNIDNLETRDTRALIPGIGFSIEPGVYLEGDVGLRSEINVYMSASGPEVTTPDPQTTIHPISTR